MPSNNLLEPALITMETLVLLENNLCMAAKVNRRFEPQFTGKIGSSLTVRKPNRFMVTSGSGLSIQSITEPSVQITVSNQKHVDFLFTDQDLTLVIEEFSERYLKPAAAALANQLDIDVMALTSQVWNEVGTPGTAPNSFLSLANVGQRMDEGGVPQDGRVLIVNSKAYWALANAFYNLFVTKASEAALKGYLANIANFEIYLDQNTAQVKNGAYAGTGVVNGASQTGASIITNGWTASITNLFLGGEVITLAGVDAVNPQNRQDTGSLMNFTITGPVNSDSGGNATLPIAPAIVTSGAYQNVTGSPANLAGVSVISGTASTSYTKNIAFVKDAFGLVTVPLDLPGGVDFAARQDYRGISMAIVRAFDITNYQMPCRLDILYGQSLFYGELACRLTN